MPQALQLSAGVDQTVTAGMSTVTNYASAGGGILSFSSTSEDSRKVIYRTAGVASFLQVFVSANSPGVSATVQSRKNLSNGNMIVSVLAGQSGIFEDVSNTDSLAAGDYFDYRIDVPSASGTITFQEISHVFNSNTSNETLSKFVVGHNANYTATTARYACLAGSISDGQTNETPQPKKIDTAGTLKNLYVYVSENGRSTDTTIMLRKGGADTTLSVLVTAGASNIGPFENTSASVSISSGDLLNYKIITGSGTGNFKVEVIAVELSTTNEKFVLFSGNSDSLTLSAGQTRYAPVAGRMTFSTDSSHYDTLTNIAVVVSNLQIHVSNNGITGTNTTSTCYLRKNGVDTNVKVSFDNTQSGQLEDANNPTIQVAATDRIKYKVEAGGTGGSLTIRGILCVCDVDVSAHDLLSFTHLDTVPGTVARGDIVTGQGSPPAWQRLPFGSAGNLLECGTTVPEPQWSLIPLPYWWIMYKSGSAYKARRWDGSLAQISNSTPQATLDAILSDILTAGGGGVYIKSGAYTWATSTVNLVSKCKIEFEPGAVFTITTNSTDVFTIDGKSDIELIGNGAEVNADSSSRTAVRAIVLKGTSSRIKIKGFKSTLSKGGTPNCAFVDGAPGNGAELSEIWISDNRIERTGRGIYGGKGGNPNDILSDWYVVNNFVKDTSVEGIRVNRCNRLFVIGNTVIDSSNNGLDVGISNSFVSVIGNQLLRAGYANNPDPTNPNSHVAHAIHTDMGNQMTIVGNTLDDCRDIAVQGSLNVTVANNVIKYGSTPNDADQGIKVSVSGSTNCVGVVVAGNIVDCNNISIADGIYLGANQTLLRVYGNIIRNVYSGGTPRKAIFDNSSGGAFVFGNEGWKTENTVLSGTQAIDSGGLKTVTIAHGLNITPNKQDCAVFYVDVTDTSQVRQQAPFVYSVDATNVVVKFNVTTAGTAGSTCRVGLRVGRL